MSVNALSFQVLSLLNRDEVTAYARARLDMTVADEQERMFASWHAPWRPESLDHYLSNGWCFAARIGEGANQKIVGFYLAQPFLFMTGLTQTLWVEHLDADDLNIARALADVAIRVGREKHLQQVLFTDRTRHAEMLQPWSTQSLDSIAVVKTTKGPA